MESCLGGKCFCKGGGVSQRPLTNRTSGKRDRVRKGETKPHVVHTKEQKTNAITPIIREEKAKTHTEMGRK